METLQKFYLDLRERGFSCFAPPSVLLRHHTGDLDAWAIMFSDNALLAREVLGWDVLAYDPRAHPSDCLEGPLPCPPLPESCFTDQAEWSLIGKQGYGYGYYPARDRLLSWDGEVYSVFFAPLVFAKTARYPDPEIQAVGKIVVCTKMYPRDQIIRKRRQLEDRLRKDPAAVVAATRAVRKLRPMK